MKLLTVAIPCYNSQEYMSHAIESILVGGEDVEIIIVNDGSKDLKHNIRGLSVPSIRKMVGTARLSMPASAMPKAFITKSWIPMTGWTAMRFCA